MSKKCESCRFYFGQTLGRPGTLQLDLSTCVHSQTPEPLYEARTVCEKAGDGEPFFFEPRVPAAGAAIRIEMAMEAAA